MTDKGETLVDKIWADHVVARDPGAPDVLYVDLHLLHEVTSPQAFATLRERGLPVRRPDRTFATVDHVVPTQPGAAPTGLSARQISALEENCRAHGIRCLGVDSEDRGIVHVVGPELGLTRPGSVIVCGDSHTSTHGAFGALAFGIGTTEVAHVLATQCLLQRRPRDMEVRFKGARRPGVTAKDVILAAIAAWGVDAARGHVIEYAGEAIRAMTMEERMTVCNMSIELGARAGLVAPDETTARYLRDRGVAAPAGAVWDRLRSDPDATFHGTRTLDAGEVEPMVTFGTTPGMAVGVTRPVPRPEGERDPARRALLEEALRYMDVPAGEPLLGSPVDVVFLGSCTNSRLDDLRAAANLLKGRSISPRVQMLVVPGSRRVQRQAEAEGLKDVFLDAGAQWREPGCSLCIAMNGDLVAPGARCVSTSNRNFMGRQGPGARTFLASPLTAAATALAGAIADPREVLA